MTRKDRRQDKIAALREQRTLNPRPEKVTDPAFSEDGFFDPLDLVQVKYEMLRRVQREAQTVTKACAAFGFSRPSFYEAAGAFEREGLAGLVPSKPGPQGPHKLTDEVMDFVEEELQGQRLSAQDLAGRVEKRFALSVHPRSIERAIQRRKKKRRQGKEKGG